jgi:hypothetical protein
VAPTASPAPPSIGAWTPIAPDPRGPTLAPAVATTGASVLAVGGRDSDGVPRAGAAEYVPATDQWRQLPDPPDHLGRADLLAISAGQEVLVVGGTAADGRPVATDLAVDPATGTWRTLASRPGGSISANSPAVWTGHELLVWPGDGGVGALPGPLGYDPATDVWRQLPAPPVAGRQHAASVWTGSEWILWGGTTGSAELADGAAYDPATDTWRTLAAAPLAGRKVRAAWTGVEMIVAAGSSGGDPVTGNGEFAFGDAAAYDPASDSWRALAAGFAHPGFQPVWTGGRVVMFAKSGAVIYDPTTDAWTDDCCDSTWFQSTPIALDGRALLVGSSDPTDGGAFYDPARAAGTAPPTETT